MSDSDVVMLEDLKSLWEHAHWADREILRAVRSAEDPVPTEAVRELAHLVAVEEVWLARLQRRPSRVEVWPALTLVEIETLAESVDKEFTGYLSALDDSSLRQPIP